MTTINTPRHSNGMGQQAAGTMIDALFHLFRNQPDRVRSAIEQARRWGIDRVCAFLSGLDTTGRRADEPKARPCYPEP